MPPKMLEAKPTLGSDGNVTWELCYKVPSNPEACGNSAATYPAVDLPAKSGVHMFHINIVNDTTGLGIKFAPDPIWIQKDTKPTVSVVDSQIDTITGSGTTQLKFRDTNTNLDPILLKYQLNFVDQAGNAVSPIDPDIKNGGGQTMSDSYVGGQNFLADQSSGVIIALAVMMLLLGGFIGALIRGRAA